MWLKFCFCFNIIKPDLVNRDYYIEENKAVLELCKKDPNCNREFVHLYDIKLESSDKNIKILEKYYEAYWKENLCQNENEPCGKMWGYCCQNMECQYLKDNLDLGGSKLNEKIGLCSHPNIKYSVP